MQSFQEAPMNKADEPEESSSWTYYFEEFSCKNDHDIITSRNETLNSLVPDAASAIVNKTSCFRDDDQAKSFKKRKTKGVAIDDSLEDTASSPLNSPKDGKYEEQNKRMAISNMELKKRGLCLVPLSALANYLS